MDNTAQTQPDAQEDEIAAQRMQRIESLAHSILQKRDEAIVGRASSGVERRWREDQDAFDGFDETLRRGGVIGAATGEYYVKSQTEPKRSQVLVNIIRGKCEIAEGRFSDIQLPVDDRNWGLKPTPVPELVKAAKSSRPLVLVETGETPKKSDGRPFTVADKAQGIMELAKEKMEAMEKEIDDQLTECGFNGENRKVVKDAVRLGTGVLKGPNVVKKVKRSWILKQDANTSLYVMQAIEEHKPQSARVDPWNVYPDPNCGEEIKKASYIWEREETLPRQLRSLIGVPGYFEDQVRKVLSEEPIRTTVASTDKKSSEPTIVERTRLEKGLAYEKWEYHGDVDRDDLAALGVEFDSDMPSLTACIVFVNDRPIKVMLNEIDTEDLPYDFFQWTQVAGSPWGIGIPRMMIWLSRIIISAWRDMMDNAGDSAGANVVVMDGIEPDDGVWEITGKKVWRGTDSDIKDARAAFAQFQIENNQEPLQRIIELALRFVDMETSLPMLFQGEKEEMPETLGATNIIVDAQNVALRSRVKIWDDQITRPHITRYYHWNMQYNKNQEIKGDYNVDPRGTSVLLARDQQAKTLIQLLPLRADPNFDDVDWSKAVKQLFKALRLDVLKSDADKRADKEAKASQPAPQNPQLQVAQIRTSGELQKAQLVQQSDMAEIKEKAEIARIEMAHQREMKMMDMKIKMMEFSQASGMALDEIKAKLAIEASKQSLMKELADKKTAQMTKPPIEPPQKAPAGEAYQK